MRNPFQVFIMIVVLTVISGLIALPEEMKFDGAVFGKSFSFNLKPPRPNFTFLGKKITTEFKLKKGLDIQGGVQVVLQADMTGITQSEEKKVALDGAREIIARRVDLFGISEPVIQTSTIGDDYRLLVDLPGIDDPEQALQLVGTTAQLDFRLQSDPTIEDSEQSTESAAIFLNNFTPTALTGKQLKRSVVQFDQQTNEPTISLEFNDEGRDIFADLTTEHTGEVLAIFLDEFPIAMPRINTPILDGRAIMSGGFTLDEAKQLAIQLNAGALPIPIKVLEQRTLGASLGQESVRKSVRAGVIGLGLVMLFMVMLYGFKGFLADVSLGVYAVLTIAIYKVLGVTLTLPGIAGLLITIGMAVDANILIFERMKEELRSGKTFERSLELGFGRAWDSIKDANLATIMTALVLVNPLNFSFLNTSGLVKGFGVTLLIGVLLGLFTGVVVTRTLMRLFLKE